MPKRTQVRTRSGYNLWGVYPSRSEALRAAAHLRSRTDQDAKVRKFPKKRQYGVYAH